VPVRIALDKVPDTVQLIAGRTATVSILGPDGQPRRGGGSQ
jgi:multidrug resistance efflux pump